MSVRYNNNSGGKVTAPSRWTLKDHYVGLTPLKKIKQDIKDGNTDNFLNYLRILGKDFIVVNNGNITIESYVHTNGKNLFTNTFFIPDWEEQLLYLLK